ncbi:uncharacterized protein TRAVEDRAFT_124195 [Trametes versicolor FP-101664 SS1]|uniref:uncharacterized protein n=1 Tax=Trametes versicolor (strain FP-101664) TaxID=717944 RepID=UPI0004623EF3|nr:uncharacterized protein TRAVEDRAFT_124195 [Trametes versicolor FP-101664 SS1]EIW58820.1 hypothetical protein TRAVEDRAFT_124195 [Trametes versicolor FP-101664 SS1]
MQHFASFFFVIAALIVAIFGLPSPTVSAGIVSDAQLDLWLATTNATLIFVGDDSDVTSNSPTRRSAQTTRIVYCASRAGNVCGGVCTVYSGGASCIDAPKTMCMSATRNVGYCDKSGCTGSCNDLSHCGTPLDGGFCLTANTNSIVVSSI